MDDGAKETTSNPKAGSRTFPENLKLRKGAIYDEAPRRVISALPELP